jgi:hypothetical protein
MAHAEAGLKEWMPLGGPNRIFNFELCGLLDGQVTGLGTLTDAIDVARCSADNHAERHRSWGNQG